MRRTQYAVWVNWICVGFAWRQHRITTTNIIIIIITLFLVIMNTQSGFEYAYYRDIAIGVMWPHRTIGIHLRRRILFISMKDLV